MPAPTIGILAGMGPRSTGPFLDLVVTQCQRRYGARHDVDFPKMLICSQPAPFYEDRPIDHEALEGAIREGLQTLEAAGADFLAIACNTAHIYFESLAASVRVPLLSILEESVRALPGSVRTLALVAARPTVEAGIYQTALRAAGRTPLDLGWQGEIDAMLAATRDTLDPEVFRRRWARLLAQAQEAGADAVLVACLDLSGVLRYAESPLPLLDAADSLAAAIVERWLAGREGWC